MLTALLIALTYVAECAGILAILAVFFSYGRWWE